MDTHVTAVRYLAPVGRGTSRPNIFMCDDGRSYVIKTFINPQGPRILPNEWIAYRLGSLIGLPIPEARFVSIPHSLLHSSPQISGIPALLSGPHFGSLYDKNTIFEPTPTQLAACVNLGEAAGMIAFDNWIKNWDRCWRRGKNILVHRRRKSRLILIDHGCAFTGTHWNPATLKRDKQKRAVYWGENYRQFVKYIDGPNPLHQSVLSIQSLDDAAIHDAVTGMPPEWNVTDRDSEALADYLIDRKANLPGMLLSLAPHFPVWRTIVRHNMRE